ncbi:MAG: EamA family transporter, partial [Candidatus Heimdallarchaeota archaeon]
FFAGNRGKQKSKFTKKGVLLVLLAGIIGNTFGSLFYLLALSFTEASTTAAITAASPLIASPLSILFLKEKTSLVLFMGTLLTISGIWLIILY